MARQEERDRGLEDGVHRANPAQLDEFVLGVLEGFLELVASPL